MASASDVDAGGWQATARCSNREPTCMVRRRVVSTAGTSPRGRNSDINVRARAYGSKDPIFAMRRSYSGVHRSGHDLDDGVERTPAGHPHTGRANQMVLQSRECPLDRPRRALNCVATARADFVCAGAAIAPGQLHHDAPLQV
jgi:hypothetical protein